MTSARKFAKEIHAWADGETIQYLNPNDLNPVWKDIDTPGWVGTIEYRIKPKVVTHYVQAKRYITRDTFDGKPGVFCLQFSMREKYFPDKQPGFIKWIDYDWGTFSFEVEEKA